MHFGRHKICRRWWLIMYTVLGAVLLSSCQKEPPFTDDPTISKRTVMVYIAANNNLVTDAYENLNQMESAFRGIDGKLIVYARLTNAVPALYEISYDDTPFINSKRIKEYPPHNSSDPDVMKAVFSDMQQLYPAESYGAILWSHATSWLPPNAGQIRLKSFGDDAGQQMDIKDLNNALPNNLDFLIFDACSMASVEVLYEIREKAKYIVASPAEVLAVGMPYHLFMNDLFADDLINGLKTVATHFYNYYNTKTGINQSATISLLDMSRIDALAIATKNLMTNVPIQNQDYRRDELQRLDFLPDSPTAGFDFLDFLDKNYDQEAIVSVKEALDKVVLYKAHTPNFNNFPIVTFSGLSTYVPHPDNEILVHDYYRTLRWYDASGYTVLF